MEINNRHVEDRGLLDKAYVEFLGKHGPKSEAETMAEFAAFYLAFFPLDAWVGRELSDLHAFLLGLVRVLQKGIVCT